MVIFTIVSSKSLLWGSTTSPMAGGGIKYLLWGEEFDRKLRASQPFDTTHFVRPSVSMGISSIFRCESGRWKVVSCYLGKLSILVSLFLSLGNFSFAVVGCFFLIFRSSILGINPSANIFYLCPVASAKLRPCRACWDFFPFPRRTALRSLADNAAPFSCGTGPDV